MILLPRDAPVPLFVCGHPGGTSPSAGPPGICLVVLLPLLHATADLGQFSIAEPFDLETSVHEAMREHHQKARLGVFRMVVHAQQGLPFDPSLQMNEENIAEVPSVHLEHC